MQMSTSKRTIYLLPARQAQLQPKVLAPRPAGNFVVRSADPATFAVRRVEPRAQSVQTCRVRLQAPALAKPTVLKTVINGNTHKNSLINQQQTAIQQPLKRAATMAIDDILNETCNQPTAPRKRERLNHLTAEEKLNRRKMKNRVAAQTARDRKKERTSILEDAVRRLFSENERLREENLSLRERMDRLEERTNIHDISAVSGKMAVARTLESAAFISEPQQREQAKPRHSTPQLLIWWAALLSLTLKNSPTSLQISKRSILTRSARTCSAANTQWIRSMIPRMPHRAIRVGVSIRVRPPRSLWGRVS